MEALSHQKYNNRVGGVVVIGPSIYYIRLKNLWKFLQTKPLFLYFSDHLANYKIEPHEPWLERYPYDKYSVMQYARSHIMVSRREVYIQYITLCE